MVTRPKPYVRKAPQAKVRNPPRAWRCSSFGALYCPIHHDCTCKTAMERNINCALHGKDTTHPTDVELIL